MADVVQTYNQQEADGSWSQVAQWDDGSFTGITIDPSQYAAYGIPTGATSPVDQWNSDTQAGLPSPSNNESGVVQNPSDPAAGSQSSLVSTMYYVDCTVNPGLCQIIQKDMYSDGQVVFLNTSQVSYLPQGTASLNMWDLVGLGPGVQNTDAISSASAARSASAPPADSSGQGTGTQPAAVDGQTLNGQSAWTQASYRALYGGGAAQRWVQDHNAAIGQQASAALQQNNPARPTATQVTNQPVRAAANKGSMSPWLIGGALIVGALALSGKHRR